MNQLSVRSQESDGADRPSCGLSSFVSPRAAFFDLKVPNIERRSGGQTCRRREIQLRRI
ncbi:hypothetical protein [Microcoleus sp. SVA1_A4]|uniref:hypothetical protein n=1 Tax=Microcoleus sp. SVA1_A4 TaxID=2818948 RepID=UPI002FD50C99